MFDEVIRRAAITKNFACSGSFFCLFYLFEVKWFVLVEIPYKQSMENMPLISKMFFLLTLRANTSETKKSNIYII